jgi:hypothetical protein
MSGRKKLKNLEDYYNMQLQGDYIGKVSSESLEFLFDKVVTIEASKSGHSITMAINSPLVKQHIIRNPLELLEYDVKLFVKIMSKRRQKRQAIVNRAMPTIFIEFTAHAVIDK